MKNPTELDFAMAEIVNAFLRWPLPKTVAADGCATRADYPHLRTGTNLLTCPEAVSMVQEVVRPIVEKLMAEKAVANTKISERPAAGAFAVAHGSAPNF